MTPNGSEGQTPCRYTVHAPRAPARGIMTPMSTKDDLTAALKDAMRQGDNTRKKALRSALASLKLAEVEEGADLEDDRVHILLQKEVKARQETIADAEQADRPELAADAEAEIEVLQSFLPEQLDREELIEIIQETILEVDASGPRDIGKVMQAVIPKVRGRADGRVVNEMVSKMMARP